MKDWNLKFWRKRKKRKTIFSFFKKDKVSKERKEETRNLVGVVELVLL